MARQRADFIGMYAARAPLALAFERTLECKLLSAMQIRRPVLDLGCGDGLFANVLFQDRIETGVDPDPKELEQASKRDVYEELICCRGDKIPKPDSSYNTIISNSVLEHIPDLEPVLGEAFRLLMPGGVFYCTVPAETFEVWTLVNLILSSLGLRQIATRYRVWFNQFWKHYHVHSRADWETIVSKAGFDVVESARYDAPRVALINDALVPLALPSMLLRKFAGRWVLSRTFREIILGPFRPLLEKWVENVGHPAGCLVFLKAVKPSR